MPQKNYINLYWSLLYMPLTSSIKLKTKILIPQVVSSLEFSISPKLGNTSKFFKKLAFIGLAFSNIMFNRCRIVTIRSVIASLWDMIATHVIIF